MTDGSDEGVARLTTDDVFLTKVRDSEGVSYREDVRKEDVAAAVRKAKQNIIPTVVPKLKNAGYSKQAIERFLNYLDKDIDRAFAAVVDGNNDGGGDTE